MVDELATDMPNNCVELLLILTRISLDQLRKY